MKYNIILIFMISLAMTSTAMTQKQLEEQIKTALTKGKKYIKLKPGKYYLNRPLLLSNMNKFRIEGRGAKVVVTKYIPAVIITNSSDLTIRDLSFDYDPLPFTQGTISAVSEDHKSFTFKLHKGYPELTPEINNNRAHVFNSESRQWKKNCGDLYGKTKYIAKDKGCFTASAPHLNIKTGDLLCLNIGRSPAFIIRGCEKLKFINLTIFSSPGAAFIGRLGMGDDYYRVTIKRGERPHGATEDRLMSILADAVNYAYVRKGPTLEKCDFSFHGDDSLNLHSVVMPVVKIIDKNTFRSLRPYARESFDKVIKTGDKIRILAPKTFEIIHETQISSFSPVNNSITKEVVKKYFPVFRNKKKFRYTEYIIKVEDPIDKIPEGAMFDIPAIAGNNFIIKDSFFHDQRARGMRIMASNGTVENNRFARIKYAAISLGPEYGYWGEAGWVNNIKIKNNHISDVCTGNSIRQSYAYLTGAISIFVSLPSKPLKWPRSNSNILIENNTIQNCPVNAIFVNASNKVKIINNTIKNVCYDKNSKSGRKYGLYSNKPINVKNSTEVILKNNK